MHWREIKETDVDMKDLRRSDVSCREPSWNEHIELDSDLAMISIRR